jgi:uncharacterized protein
MMKFSHLNQPIRGSASAGALRTGLTVLAAGAMLVIACNKADVPASNSQTTASAIALKLAKPSASKPAVADTPSAAERAKKNAQFKEKLRVKDSLHVIGFMDSAASGRISVDTRDEEGKTALMYAALKGDTVKVRQLLRRGADQNAWVKDEYPGRWPFLDHGVPVLMFAAYAAFGGNTGPARILLVNGANPNMYVGEYHTSVLIAAAARGHMELARLLLARGADVNQCSDWATTPLIQAIENKHLDMAELLLEHHPILSRRDDRGRTPLDWAVLDGSAEGVRLLLERKAPVNGPGIFRGTLLNEAVTQGDMGIVRMLLDAGADVNARDRHGRTAYDCAVDCGFTEIAGLLQKKMAK